METLKPKFELYRTRTFTEKLNDTISYLRDSWRPQLKYFIYLMLPCCMVLAFFMNHFWSGYMSFIMSADRLSSPADGAVHFLVNAGLMAIVFLSAYTLLVALVYAMLRLYMVDSSRLDGLTAQELKPELLFCLRRSSVLMLFSLAVGIAALLILAGLLAGAFSVSAGFGLVSMVPLYAGLLVLFLPLMLMTPIYMIEDDVNVIAAFTKAFHLGFPTWGGIFALTFIVGIITSIVQMVTMGPWYVLFIIKMVFTLSKDLDGSFAHSVLFVCGEYATCVLQCLGMMLASAINLVALAIQYGHASDKVDGMGLAEKIEQFGKY